MEYDNEVQVSIGQFEFWKVCKSTESIEEGAELARAVRNAWHGGEGIPESDFNAAIDCLIAGEPVLGGIELWEKMSAEQKTIAQAIKRSKKRLSYKKGKEE